MSKQKIIIHKNSDQKLSSLRARRQQSDFDGQALWLITIKNLLIIKPHSQKSVKRQSVLYKQRGAEMASLVALVPKSPAVWAKSSSAGQAKLQPPSRPLPSASFHGLGLLPLPVREEAQSHRADTGSGYPPAERHHSNPASHQIL